MIKVTNKNTRTTSKTSLWCFYCYLWTYFTAFSSITIVDFEEVNVSWDIVPAFFSGLREYMEGNTLITFIWAIWFS